MSEYLVNPRRAPRAPARCAAQVTAPDGTWSAQTEDIGPTGCQLIAPGRLARSQRLSLTFSNPQVAGTLQVEGKVAWCSPQPPWRVGVAFADATRPAAERWFALLVAAHPGAGAFRRVPERLPIDAMLFLSPPPTLLVDFTDDEVAVLCHVASGTTLASLRERLGSTWSASQRATFSLLSRGMVTVSRSASAHPAAWKKVMAELGAEFVVAAPRAARPAPFTEAVTLAGDPAPDLDLEFELAPEEAPPPLPPPLPLPAASARPPPLPTTAAPDGLTAGTGWRGGARARSREAQECFDLGRTELAAGRSSSALAHLRRALQLAPGDAEIAAEIGRAMSKA